MVQVKSKLSWASLPYPRAGFLLRLLLPVGLVCLLVTRNYAVRSVYESSNIELLQAVEPARTTVPPVSCDKGRNGNDMVMAKNKKQTILKPPFWISLHDRAVDQLRWGIMRSGQYYETGITRMFQEILQGQPRGIVLDVGMNIGWFSLLSRSLGHKVISFEPNPMNIDRMCESLRLNGWDKDDSVSIFQAAMGSEPGTMFLSWNRKNPGSGRVTTEDKAQSNKIKTRVLTVDEIVQQEGLLASSIPIHLMKVDVEGFETKVFGGAEQLIQSGKVRNILMEISPPYSQEKIDLLGHLIRVGRYRVKSISDSFGQERPGVMEKIQAVKSSNLDDYVSTLTKAIYGAGRSDHLNFWLSRGD